MSIALRLVRVQRRYWLRKSYSRFDTGEILPIEFGVMTTIVVTGGFFVFDELVRTH